MKNFILTLFFISLFVPSSGWGLYENKGENYSFSSRGAIDLSTGFNDYANLESLYPSSEGFEEITARLLLDGQIGEQVRLEINGYQKIQSLPDIATFIPDNESYRTKYLERKWLDDENTKAILGFDQVSAKIYADPIDLTIGRQPVSLATNFIFTPNDVFYPFSSTEVDREFRPGVDAIRIDTRTGMLSKITCIGVLGYESGKTITWEKSAALVTGSMNWKGFDWSVLGGKIDQAHVAGAAFSGEVFGLGLRFEGNATFPTEKNADSYMRLAGGIDHRWENSLHLIVEYYYRENGETDPDAYLDSMLIENLSTDPFLGKHYLGATIAYEATPLITVQGITLINIADASCYISPSITYSAGDEIELIAIIGLPVGNKPDIISAFPPQIDLNSEYGIYPKTLVIQARFYF